MNMGKARSAATGGGVMASDFNDVTKVAILFLEKTHWVYYSFCSFNFQKGCEIMIFMVRHAGLAIQTLNWRSGRRLGLSQEHNGGLYQDEQEGR